MQKIKKIFLSIITFMLCMVPVIKADAATPVNIYFFYGNGCGFCASAEEWFEGLDEETLAKINLVRFEVWGNSNNSALLTKAAELFEVPDDEVGIPFMVIGDETIIGFGDSTPDRILELVDELYETNNRYDLGEHIDLSTGTAEGNLVASPSNQTSDAAVVIALAIIVVGVVGLLTYAKIKTN